MKTISILTNSINPFWQKTLTLLAIVLVVGVIFSQGLPGDFVFDDRLNIELNSAIYMERLNWESIANAWNASKTGNIGRPVAMLSFGLSHYFSGLDASGFKQLNIAIHCLNTVLVILIIFSLLEFRARSTKEQDERLDRSNNWLWASVVGALWALHPLQVSSVLYVVQRMNLLSTLFTLLPILLFIFVRHKVPKNRIVLAGCWFGVIVLWIAGMLSKENAALLPLYLLLIEYFTVPPQRRFWASRPGQQVMLVTIIITGLLALYYLHFYANWFSAGYELRAFTMYERLLSQARVLMIYQYWILVPDISQYGLFQDAFSPSRSLLNPLTTLTSLCSLVFIGSLCWFMRNRLPLFSFGMLFFFVGHLLESSIVPLELVFEHRNYLPSLGMLVAVSAVARVLLAQLSLKGPVTIIAIAAVLLYFGLSSWVRAADWSSFHRHMTVLAQQHPMSARSQWGLAMSYIRQYDQSTKSDQLQRDSLYRNIVLYSKRAFDADRDYVASYLGLLVFHYRYDLPFPPSLLSSLKERLATSYYRFSTDNYLKQLIYCHIEPGCYAQTSEIDALFQSLDKNPNLPRGVRANIYDGEAAFYYETKRVGLAYQTMLKANKVKPSQERKKNVALLYSQLGEGEK